MKTKNRVLAACLVLSLAVQAFNKEDVHFVVGEGDAQCYFVIDWYGAQKCWAFRWRSSGYTPNVFEALKAIDHEDPRFKIAHGSMTAAFVNIYFMGYDEDDCACQWDVENGCSSSSAALVGRQNDETWNPFWVFYQAGTRSDYGTSPIYSSWYAANSVQVANEQVYYFMIGSPYDASYNETPITPDESKLTFAESPYGWRVVASYTSETKTNFNNPTNVLHRPTCYMDGMWGGPVSPYNPAWMAGELFSMLDEDEYVTIEFDHPVVDDPNNPWGIDLLVFGNAMGEGTTKDYYEETSDPGNWAFDGKVAADPGVVEVSADGEHWFSFDKGPFCDDWAPTYGLIYDKANADTNWFAGNKWWSVTTDATWPVNPNTSWADIEGLTVETLSYRYDKSAGGAGFDISGLDLPRDSKGRKYIRFVRISSRYDEEEEEWTQPEVDAVADVRPATQYEQWKIENYTNWNTAWNTNQTGKAKIAANGLPNVVNQVIGLGANESPVISISTDPVTGDDVVDEFAFKFMGLTSFTNYVDLYFRSKKPLSANSGIMVKRASNLNGPWTDELPYCQEPEALADGTYKNTLRVSNTGRFFKLSIDE